MGVRHIQWAPVLPKKRTGKKWELAPAFVEVAATHHDMEQGSLEWQMLRSEHLTASELAAACGLAKYKPKTLHQLMQVKLGNARIEDNYAMKRGRELEPVARRLFAEYMNSANQSWDAVVLTRGPLLASLDGAYFRDDLCAAVAEFKNPMSAESLTRNEPPDHYLPQLAQQALVSNAETVFYVEHFAGNLLVIEIPGEELRALFVKDYQAHALKAVALITSGTVPAPGPDDTEDKGADTEWTAAAAEYIELARVAKEANDQLELAREKLLALSGDQSCEGGGVKVSWYERAGSVNWNKLYTENEQALHLAGIEPENYRGAGSRSARITIVEPETENGY